jgi:hypothetical protein
MPMIFPIIRRTISADAISSNDAPSNLMYSKSHLPPPCLRVRRLTKIVAAISLCAARLFKSEKTHNPAGHPSLRG